MRTNKNARSPDEGIGRRDASQTNTASISPVDPPARRSTASAKDRKVATIEAPQAAKNTANQPKNVSKTGGFEIVEKHKDLRDGVYFHGKNKDGDSLPPEFICSPLRVLARTRDVDNVSWGLLLEWCDPERKLHRWAMPSRLLSSGGDEYRGELLDHGLMLAPGGKARNLLTTYLQAARTKELARCTERTGWHDGQFVLPHRVIGASGEQVVFQTDKASAAHYGERGTLDDWRQSVASPCIGHSRLVFSVSTAFASTLIEPLGEENGGFHLQGGSSEGKTTCLLVAASVFGANDYLHRWRATANGLEAIATAHSGSLLILDEMGQVDPREAGETAYMLANGTGKHRATRIGGARKSQSWRLLFLSSGEVDLATHMAAAGKTARAGQEVRLLSFHANAGKGFGVFDNLGSCESGAALARDLTEQSRKFYGTAGPTFIERLSKELDDIPRQAQLFLDVFLKTHLPPDASGQVHRAAQRFALVAFGGELATTYEITGWRTGEAEAAAAACFQAWLEGRGGAGDSENRAILAQVVRFFENHGESRFHNGDTPGEPRIINRAGVRANESGTWVYYVLRETFLHELCSSFDQKQVVSALESAGMLERGKDGRPAALKRLPGIGKDPVRCYQIRPFPETS